MSTKRKISDLLTYSSVSRNMLGDKHSKRKVCVYIDHVPCDCILEIIARSSPRDAYNFALTSKSFESVVDSDFVWQSFLPSDHASILSRADEPLVCASKKDLFFKLSECHVLLDIGTMSFGLERTTGAIRYMISASLLKIAFANEPHLYWREVSRPDSRFSRGVGPTAQCDLSIMAKFNMEALSQKTRYGAHLIYKLAKTPDDVVSKIGRCRQQASISVNGKRTESIVYLEPSYDVQVKELYSGWGVSCDEIGKSAKERNDGWMEVEIGEFCTSNINEGDTNVTMMLKEMDTHHCQGGIVVEGIELRPKH